MSGRAPIPLAERVPPKVDMSGGPEACWEWRASRDFDGYGQVSIGSRTAGTRSSTKAHRVMYELFVGQVPDGFMVCHRCDNPPCCNPAHLFAAPPAENSADMIRKKRSLQGDRNPARVNPGNLRRGDDHPFRQHPELAARGERASQSKLTEALVRDLRARAQAGESHSSIARELGVTHTTVGRIVRRQSWAHVA